ncbi:hypothetical protein NDU88_011302 [Pleurodeles waltl]|uniref:Secreted protein n=1 Tax=Pleurodeles waltl TaxID=8319 RepID=A0AAV7R2Z4_PLEWA|nr:hypothetical protein NDU88_011302 [Pleurodeles waltl]
MRNSFYGVLTLLFIARYHFLTFTWWLKNRQKTRESQGLILSPAGGGSRPPGGSRQMTAPRSKDRGAIQTFPLGRRALSKRAPAGPEEMPLQRGRRLRIEPA